MGNLLETQKDAVFKSLDGRGLKPAEFRWREDGAETVLEHVATGYSFSVRLKSPMADTYVLHYSPGSETIRREVEASGWSNATPHVTAWADALRRELAAPRLWSNVIEATATLRGVGSVSAEASLTSEDKDRIAEQIAQIHERLGQIVDRQTEAFERISRELEYIKSSSTKFNKKDWLNIASGAITNLLTSQDVREALGSQIRDFIPFALQSLQNAVDSAAAIGGTIVEKLAGS